MKHTPLPALPLMPRRRLLAGGLGLAALSNPLASLADGDKYPSRPINLIVPFPPGGSVDVMARTYADPLGRLLGVPIVIDHKPGAGGSIGSQFVARAKPDGYTLVVSSQSSHLANPLVQPKLGYDPIKDFESIAILGRQPNVLVVHPSLPVRTFQEFLAYVKERPGQLNFCSAGAGSMGQLNVEMLMLNTGIKDTHVPYTQAGKMLALAVASPTRLPQLPDVPTFTELGHANLNQTSWTGLAAPANTPAPVVQALYKAVREVATSAAMQDILKQRGVIAPEEMSPKDFEKMMADRLVVYGDVVRRANVKPE